MLQPTIAMTKQQGSSLSPSSEELHPLEMSQAGDLSEPQMLDQMLNQMLAQLPEVPTQPEAMAGMMTKILEESDSSQLAPGAQPQSSSEDSNQPNAQPQQSSSRQSLQYPPSDAQQHLSSAQSPQQQTQQTPGGQSQSPSLQDLSQIIDPMMSETQQLMSSLENLDLFGTDAQPPLDSGQTSEQIAGVSRQSASEVQEKTSPSTSSTPMPQKDTLGFSVMPEVFSAETTNLSPTQTSEAPNTSATVPSTAIAEANLQEGQVPNQSPSSGNGTTRMGDLSLGEFLPDSGELQRLFEQSMGAVLPQESVIPASPHPGSGSMGVEALPQLLGSTPEFYFLRDSKAAESTSPEVPKQGQPLSLPQDGFDVEAVRRDFPILHQQIHGKPLIWMDNAATSQKPQSVIETLSQFYEEDNSNVHRGAHTLAARATNAYEDAREKIQRFLGASLAKEIVFVRGTSEGINLVAQTHGRQHVKAGDEIVLTTLEHHSNIVPWQMLAQEKGAVLKVAPISDKGEVLLEEYEKLLSDRTRIVALSHVSNVLGTVLPIKAMAAMAHRHGATVVVDGAQSVPHFRPNVQDLGADFYVFSGHKLFGPTGIGALYGKAALLKEMPPWQGGGNMIESVSFEKTTFNDIPAKFEAGTGNLAAAVGLGTAIDYLNQIGFEAAAKHEEALMAYATAAMAAIPGLRQIGTAVGKVSTLSFILKNISPEDMGKFLDSEGIAVRAGHHCAQPTMKRFGVTSTVRPSLAFYNTFEEIDALIAAIKKAQHQLS